MGSIIKIFGLKTGTVGVCADNTRYQIGIFCQPEVKELRLCDSVASSENGIRVVISEIG